MLHSFTDLNYSIRDISQPASFHHFREFFQHYLATLEEIKQEEGCN